MAASLQHLPPGTILRDKYMLGRALGQSDYGITYAALDLNMDLPLVVKEYYPLHLLSRRPKETEVRLNSDQCRQEYNLGLNRFLAEAKKLAPLSEHSNLVTLRDFFQDRGSAYLILTSISGVSLEQYLEQNNGKLPLDQALRLLLPAAKALKSLHSAGLLHLNLNPENIMIDAEDRAVLIGFGLNRQKMRDAIIVPSVAKYSGYSAPEQYCNDGKQGFWTDIYALAGVFYRSITGQRPFDAIERYTGKDIALTQPGLDIYLEQVLSKALALKVDERYQAIDSFCEALTKSNTTDKSSSVTGFNVELEPGLQQGGSGHISLEAESVIAPASIATLDVDYYIDYTGGSISIGELPIGARVADPSWEWEFRTGNNYSGSGNVKPVTWIVVAKNHYEGLDPHITLLAEELIGQFPFDDSTDRGSIRGSNHWGESGTGKATHGLRLWLNSIGLQSGKGFYSAFSEGFKRAMLTTTVPNKEWENGNAYNTSDNVFISSTTELGDTDHNRTYPIGTAYAYFQGANDAKRVTRLDTGSHLYWTRSPDSYYGNNVRAVNYAGGFYFYSGANSYVYIAVRPAVNLKSGILVSEIND